MVFWAVRKRDLGESDPVVWQDVNGNPIEWHAEDYRLSRFLMAMWKWTVTGEEDSPEPEPFDDRPRLSARTRPH